MIEEDDLECGIDPEDDETEEYEEDQEDACGIFDDIASAELRESDYPNRRRFNAAWELAELNASPEWYAPEAYREQWDICQFILTGKGIAAKYLTVGGRFLFVQAAKERFSLPCTFPEEDESPETYPWQLIMRVSRRDPRLAAEVWAWWVREFSPYLSYSSDKSMIYNGIISDIYSWPKAFLPELICKFEADEVFAAALFGKNPEVPCCVSRIVCQALMQGKPAVAQLVFKAFLQNKYVTAADIESAVADWRRPPETARRYESVDPGGGPRGSTDRQKPSCKEPRDSQMMESDRIRQFR